MADDNSRLVFTSDPNRNQRCERCKNLLEACECPAQEPVPDMIQAHIRIEKAGRQGKTVTIIDRLPRNEVYLEKLAKQLKAKCGSGGTYKLTSDMSCVEIQGDHRTALPNILKKLNIGVAR